MSRRIRFLIFALLILTAGTRAAAQSHATETKAAVPVKHAPKESPVPAPAATARAVARALTDVQAQRRTRPTPQRDREVLPAEKRWQLVWPSGNERVVLAWPATVERLLLAWPAQQ